MNQINKILDPRLKFYPQDEEILRAQNEPIKKFDKSLRELINTMKDIQGQWLGIAAPQIGINKRVIVLKFEKYWVMVNPEIIDADMEKISYPEQCLSCLGEEVKIPRYKSVTIEYQDMRGEIQARTFDDLKAIAIQHEIDHIQGKLIVDYKEENNG